MKITIENFQSHSLSEIETCSGITAIVGQSDSGKSGFLRAVSACLYKTGFFLRNGAKIGSVRIEFEDGYWTKRNFRGGKLSKCPSCKEPIDGDICKCGEVFSVKMAEDYYEDSVRDKPYEKFGTKIPDVLANLIKIFPIMFVDMEVPLNFVRQHSDMFFIGESWSGGERNKILSALIPDSEKVDIAIKKMNSEAIKMGQDVEYLKEVNSEITSKLTKIGTLVEDIQQCRAVLQTLEAHADELRRDIKILMVAQAVLSGKDYSKFVSVPGKIQGNLEKLTKRIEAASKMARSIDRLETIKEKLDKTSKLDNIPDEPTYDKNMFNRIHMCMISCDKLTNIRLSLHNLSKETAKSIQESNDVDTQIEEMKLKIGSELNSQNCPLTGDDFCEGCIGKIQTKVIEDAEK